VVRQRATELVPAFLTAVTDAGARRGAAARVHVTAAGAEYVPTADRSRTVAVARADGAHDEPFVTPLELDRLAHEWEWEGTPEVSLHVVDDVDEAVDLFNTYSPHFVASLISDDQMAQDRFYASVDAPFVADGFTRWVDGQYALDSPELGLSNWESGRVLGRGAILSGDSAYTVRYRALIADSDLRR
jgi:glutamate-5-semialdehyde dehydrogenase